MRIGILGTGNMADALGTQWERAGHEVVKGGRSGPVSLAEAIEFGEVLLLALPYGVVPDGLRRKVVIDCTNPLGPELVPLGRAAEELAAVGARVVKAFNLAHVDVWRMTPPVFDGRPLAVPLCGDDEEALAAVRALVRDIGCEPVDAGGVDRAWLLEATAAFVIGLWFSGADAQAILTPL
ncbi:NADPH-dependent F420 reductase [Nonomuraea sp. NPDC050556]|uniref:NADPH-dependent F420 reductase n=1 Tax=Nonomuraea sp. NPDC050556 TaxID=3364369 RepID=UPI0037B068C8